MSLAHCYRELTNPWGVKEPWYTRPQGHSGADYRAAAGDPVLAYETITITLVQWSKFIGWCVEGRAADGRHIGWAHLRNVDVGIGDVVRKGTQLAEVAGAGDAPGTTWDGAHIHTTLSDQAEGIFAGPTIDPAPRIRAALAASPAGLDGTDDEEDDMFTQDDRNKLNNAYAGLFEGASVLIDGKAQKFNYGILPIVAHNQTLIARQAGQLAGLTKLVEQLATGSGTPIDMRAVQAAAEKGAAAALDGITITINTD